MELIRRDGSRVQICREHRKVFAGRRCPECVRNQMRARRADRKAVERQIRVWEQVNGRPFYVS
jgi:hypothetical protein